MKKELQEVFLTLLKDIDKYMQSYDAVKPSKLITYSDANNLYGRAMSQYLPYIEFKLLNQKEIDKLLLNLIKCNSTKENGSDGTY